METLLKEIKSSILEQYHTREFDFDFRIGYEIGGTSDSFRITWNGTNEKVYSIEIAIDSDMNEFIYLPEYFIEEINEEMKS